MRTRLIFTLVLLLAAAASQRAAAEVIVVPPELDLGTVAPATVVPSSVWLVNTGADAVELLSARGTCGCTVLDFTPQRLASQAALRVPVRVTAPKTPGRHKTVTVTFAAAGGEPFKMPVRLTTAGEPGRPTGVRAEPAEVDLGPVSAGSLVSASARLVNNGDTPQRVTAAKASCKCVTLPDFEPVTLAAGEAIDVHLEVETPTTLGRTSRQITFVLGGRRVVKVPVRMQTTDDRIEALQRHLGDLYPTTCSFTALKVDGEVITAIACETGDRRPRALLTCRFNDDGTVRSTLVEPIRS